MYTYVNGAKDVAAWLDKENAETLYLAEVLSMEAHIEHLKETRRLYAGLALFVGMVAGAAIALITINGFGMWCPW